MVSTDWLNASASVGIAGKYMLAGRGLTSSVLDSSTLPSLAGLRVSPLSGIVDATAANKAHKATTSIPVFYNHSGL
jgi:hypothetical protein